MHPALRSSLAILLLIACAACETHERRAYSLRRDKNLHTPDPWAASTAKAADEATSPIDSQNTPPTAPDNNSATGMPAPAPSM